MRRRGTLSRKPAKTQRRKPARPKRTRAASQTGRSVSDWQEQLERQAHELAEARDERTAIAEVLRAISNSRGDVESVFQAILDHAFAFAGPNSGRYFASTGRLFTSRQKLVLRQSMSNSSGSAALFYRLQLSFSIVCFGRGKSSTAQTSLQKLRKRLAPSLAVPDPAFPCRCSERLD